MFELIFITSNPAKTAHAKYLCRNYDMIITHQKQYGVAYNEPRLSNRERLIEESLRDAASRIAKPVIDTEDELFPDDNIRIENIKKLFFIEDTSVIIHVLSKDKEYPGLDVKYWMKEHDFKSLDNELKNQGNDRSVTVQSDIALYLPPILRKIEGASSNYKRFTSDTEGTIVEEESQFDTNILFPWLDNKTFNKWFVPFGYQCPISMLSIEEADLCDFRAGAFNEMLEYLEEFGFIKKIGEAKRDLLQISLPLYTRPVFLVSGLPCAGKTTLGAYLSQKFGYYHIEASDFMYLSYYQRHGFASSKNIADFAEKILEEDPGIVVNQIIDNIKDFQDIPIVITGFRSPEEVSMFHHKYKGSLDIENIYVDADCSERFNRSVKRGRYGHSKSLDEFRDADEQQLRMGLLAIKDKKANKYITNDGDIVSYQNDFIGFYELMIHDKKILSYDPKRRPTSLEDAIIIALSYNQDKPVEYLTTTQIAKQINKVFVDSALSTSKNNVSRYFNQYYYPYYEITLENEKKKYRLSETGYSRALFLMQYSTKP